MKILHVAPIKRNVSGMASSVKYLVESQSSYVSSIGIITSQSTKGNFSNNVKFYSILEDTYFDILLGKAYYRIINDFSKPDIVVFHDAYNIRQSFFLISIINRGIKIFITPRGAFSKVALSRSYFKKKIYYLLFIRPFIKYLKAFIALNKKEKEAIEDFTSKKTLIMSNGVNNNLEIYMKYRDNYLKKEKNLDINICFLGRFDIYIKGLDDLLNAYIDFQKLNYEKRINLIFIGSHAKNKEFNSEYYFSNIRKKLIYPDRFIIKGPFYGDRKWSELSEMDILIQPSRTEGMPNTVLEAMSIAIPCCVSKETNMGDIISDSNSGWVVKRNRESMLEYFCQMTKLNKDIFIQKGLNGMKYSKSELSWEKISKPNYL